MNWFDLFEWDLEKGRENLSEKKSEKYITTKNTVWEIIQELLKMKWKAADQDYKSKKYKICQ